MSDELLADCPLCGKTVPCERVHNGIGYVFHMVHCGWGHEVTPIKNEHFGDRRSEQEGHQDISDPI